MQLIAWIPNDNGLNIDEASICTLPCVPHSQTPFVQVSPETAVFKYLSLKFKHLRGSLAPQVDFDIPFPGP